MKLSAWAAFFVSAVRKNISKQKPKVLPLQHPNKAAL